MACRIALISSGPFARIPIAPPSTAARAKRAMVEESRKALSSAAWHDTRSFPRNADGNISEGFMSSSQRFE